MAKLVPVPRLPTHSTVARRKKDAKFFFWVWAGLRWPLLFSRLLPKQPGALTTYLATHISNPHPSFCHPALIILPEQVESELWPEQRKTEKHIFHLNGSFQN
jgi:hypothetical protein